MRRIQLYGLINTVEDAIAWCREKGILIRHTVCGECAMEMKEVRDTGRDGWLWRCRRMQNGQQHKTSLSIRDRSIFASLRVSLKNAIFMVYEWAVGTTPSNCAYELQVSKKDAMNLFAKLRQYCAQGVARRLGEQIGGEGKIVEIDECQLGRRKSHKGRIPREIWVFGGIVRDSNPPKCFIEVVRRRNEKTLLEVIRRRIHPASRIISDGWGAYVNLQHNGFIHSIVNHSENFVSPEDPTTHTQNIENLWGCLRRFLRSKGTYTRKYLLGYIAEFIFRKHFVDTFETIISLLEEEMQL